MPRRQFSARIQAFTEQRRREVAEAAAAPSLPADILMVLEDHLLVSLRRRINPVPLVRLQLRMLQDLVVAEKNISGYKKERDARQQKIAAGDPEKVRLEHEIQAIDHELYFAKAEGSPPRIWSTSPA